MNQDLTLPSGAVLKMSTAPFADAKALYQAVFEELGTTKLDLKLEDDVGIDTLKTLLCAALSSRRIDQALQKCMERALYNGQKASAAATWEPEEARADYLDACAEVARHNLSPFGRSLSRILGTFLPTIAGSLKPS